MFLLVKKIKKIVVIINHKLTINNASNSSSDFYFGHIVGTEDILQSCMLIFSSQN